MHTAEDIEDALLALAELEKELYLTDYIYVYSQERGFLMLSEEARKRHNITTAKLLLSSTDECFGHEGNISHLLLSK